MGGLYAAGAFLFGDIKESSMITVYFDGSCEPVNPGGNACYGFIVLSANKEELYRKSQFVCKGEKASNNVAEYAGLLGALQWLNENGYNSSPIEIVGDSQLVINQMSGKWGINGGLYVEYAKKCKTLISDFKNLSFRWVKRDFNIADAISRLSNGQPNA